MAGTGLYLPAKIKNQRVECLIDTGAEVSLAKEDFAPIGADKNRVPITSITGQAIPTIGQGTVKIKANGQEYEAPVIFADVGEEIVLGNDFLSKEGAVINYPRREVKLDRNIHKITMKTDSRISKVEVRKELPEHLRDLYERSQKDLLEGQWSTVRQVLLDFESTFSTGGTDIGKTGIIKHPIDVEGHPPIKQRVRRLPLGKRQEEQRLIQEMLRTGVIRESVSPWASPVVMVG